jgi:hypothetical protein
MEERNANRSIWPNSQARSRFAEEERATQKKEQTCTTKLQELRRRKSKPALPNSKSFAEERANEHCQTPKALQKSKP